MSDWSFLSYTLATHGIPSDVEEAFTDSYEPDPWRPLPGTDSVLVMLNKDDATRLVGMLEELGG